MDIRDSIGQIIREKRTDKGWTQEKLSSEAGVSNRFIQNIEAGEKMASLITIFKLSQALEVTPDVLIMPAWEEW